MRPLRAPARGQRHLAREIVRPRPVKVVTTLHGTDITPRRAAAVLLLGDQVLDRAVGRSDRGLGLAPRSDPEHLRRHLPDPGHPQLVDVERSSHRPIPPPALLRARRARGSCMPELPDGEERPPRGGSVPRRPGPGAGPPADGGRGAGRGACRELARELKIADRVAFR
jgi:hypothetical protein